MSPAQVRRRLHNLMQGALAKTKRGQVFLEIFAGAGGVSEAWSAEHAFGVVRLDILFDPAHDLTRQVAMQTVLGWIASGLIRAMWLAPPCSTWSSAARILCAGKWTRYRTREFIHGGPWLEARHLVRVGIGNRLCNASARLVQAALRANVPTALENHMAVCFDMTLESQRFSVTVFVALP